MGRLQDQVALITGAARGQGRSHAVRLAEEGANIIAVDLCEQVDSAPYPMSTEADLQETARLVEAAGGRCETHVCDVRDVEKLTRAVAESVEVLGRLDIVSANAGVISYGTLDELPEQTWKDAIDINLTGVWHTAKAAIPHIRAGGRGGSIHVTVSALGLIVLPNIGHYASAKHALTGLVRTLALELGKDKIRVNAIHPGQCDTDLIQNEATYKLFCPDIENPTKDDFIRVAKSITALDIPYVEPVDISNALLFLASDEGRYITGVTLSVDGGTVIM